MSIHIKLRMETPDYPFISNKDTLHHYLHHFTLRLLVTMRFPCLLFNISILKLIQDTHKRQFCVTVSRQHIK